MALKNSKTGSLPVSEIYGFMKEHFPYFKVRKAEPNGVQESGPSAAPPQPSGEGPETLQRAHVQTDGGVCVQESIGCQKTPLKNGEGLHRPRSESWVVGIFAFSRPAALQCLFPGRRDTLGHLQKCRQVSPNDSLVGQTSIALMFRSEGEG